jgi:hypothetical protein
VTTTEAVELHPVEVDLLCELAEVRAPFPLAVPSTGTTLTERRMTFAAARHQLALRGLAGDRGPSGPAATFVRSLRTSTGAIHLVIAEGGRNVGAVALVSDLRALLLVQSPDEPGEIIRLTELGVDDAVRELCALVPAVDAGGVPAFTLPLAPIRQVVDLLHRPDADALTDNDIDSLLFGSGVDERLAGRLVTALRQVTGSGQAGIARWRHGRWQRSGTAAHWVDTARGRFRLSQSADGLWASVNPFSRNDVRATMRELGARVRNVNDEESRP